MLSGHQPQKPQPLIALLTDFGTTDPYVGTMKGVIARYCPEAHCIDLTHAVRAHNVRQAAYLLRAAYRHFPAHTVFLVVVDPGVGTQRRPVAIATEYGTFVGPDNGVFEHVLAAADTWQAVEISPPAAPISYTFHGRDLFAPAAATLACGTRLRDIGIPITDVTRLDALITVHNEHGILRGEVIHVDHFGNLITSIGPLRWQGDAQLMLDTGDGHLLTLAAPNCHVRIGGVDIAGIRRFYGAVEPGMLLSVVSSDENLEIAVNMGSAAQRLGVGIGAMVEVVVL